MGNKEELIEKLEKYIKYYDDEFYSHYRDSEPKYQSYCSKVGHIGTMLEYLRDVLIGKETDFKYVKKYSDELERYVAFECYDDEFIEKLKKELEWTQQQ